VQIAPRPALCSLLQVAALTDYYATPMLLRQDLRPAVQNATAAPADSADTKPAAKAPTEVPAKAESGAQPAAEKKPSFLKRAALPSSADVKCW